MPAASPTWPFRLARATVFAVVCLALGAAAHVLAGGCLSASSAATGLALTFAVALPLAGRERTHAAILPALAGAQAGLHVYFCLAHVSSFAEAAEHLSDPGCCGLVPDTGMAMMHAWAVGLTALWLARGETLLWALLRRAGARLRLLIRVPAGGVLSAPRPPRPADPAVLRSAVLRRAVRLRGPPGTAYAVAQAGQRVPECGARGDAELREHAVEVRADGPW